MEELIAFGVVAAVFTAIVGLMLFFIKNFLSKFPTNNEEELRQEVIDARKEAIKQEVEALKPNEVKDKFKEAFKKRSSVFDRPEITFNDADPHDE